jgi:ubiquinone/menaquinone biosynthesis C-methylase UbiE
MEDMTETDPARRRFAVSAERLGRLTDERADALRERVRHFVPLTGRERALDTGTGTGALAFALSPLVREVVAADTIPEMLEEGRRRAAAAGNVEFVEADAMALPFANGEFDLAGSLRTLHHLPRPELAVSELVRVTRPGGLVLVVDQIAPIDPLAALELDRFERARDPSHTRVLPDTDMRGLFDANDLILRRAEFETQRREVEPYLDLAGCEGEVRQRARSLAGGDDYEATIGWYLLVKPGLS